MMMPRKIRWIFLYIVILMMSFVCIVLSIKNNAVRVYREYGEEKELSITLETNKKIIMSSLQNQKQALLKVDSALLDSSSVIDDIVRDAALKNISVTNIQLFSIKNISGMNMLPVKLNAVGDFSGFVKLIVDLFNGPRILIINDFAFHRDERGVVTAEIQLVIFGMHADGMKYQNVN